MGRTKRNPTDETTTESQSSKKSKITNDNENNMKALNFPATFFKIGTWMKAETNEGDIIVKIYFKRAKLLWEFLEDRKKIKIEMNWSTIASIRACFSEANQDYLEVELNQPPLFFRENDPQPRKHTDWAETADFTGDQASIYRVHHLSFRKGTLEKHYAKILGNLRFQTTKTTCFPSHSSQFFEFLGPPVRAGCMSRPICDKNVGVMPVNFQNPVNCELPIVHGNATSMYHHHLGTPTMDQPIRDMRSMNGIIAGQLNQFQGLNAYADHPAFISNHQQFSVSNSAAGPEISNNFYPPQETMVNNFPASHTAVDADLQTVQQQANQFQGLNAYADHPAINSDHQQFSVPNPAAGQEISNSFDPRQETMVNNFHASHTAVDADLQTVQQQANQFQGLNVYADHPAINSDHQQFSVPNSVAGQEISNNFSPPQETMVNNFHASHIAVDEQCISNLRTVQQKANQSQGLNVYADHPAINSDHQQFSVSNSAAGPEISNNFSPPQETMVNNFHASHTVDDQYISDLWILQDKLLQYLLYTEPEED